MTIADTTPPTITGVPDDTNVSCNAGIPGYSVGASDNCSTPSLSFSAVTNGSCPVVITRIWTTTDDCGNSAAATQAVTIVDTTPPSLSCPNPITLTGAAVTCLTAIPDLRPTASDTCDTSVIAVTQNPAPGSMVAGPTNVSVVITASDVCGNEASCTTMVAIVCPECLITDVSPAVNCNGQGTGNEADDTFSVSIVVTADNGTTFSVSGDATATGLAYGVQHTLIASRLITAGSVSLTITDDADPNCASNLVVNPPAPCSDCAITEVRVATVCDDNGTGSPDDDMYSVTVFAAGTGVATYAISGDITASNLIYGTSNLVASGLLISSGPLTINVSDEVGSCASNGIVVAAPPPCSTCPPVVIGCPSNVTVECDASTDPADTGRADPGATYVDTTNGTCPEIITRVWTLTNDCGNADSCTQTITIVDTTPPTITGVPADTNISCDVGIPGYSVGASDNCSTPSLSFSAVTNGSCPQVITRIWTATDDCGNSSTASQVVTIADTTPPTITGVPADTNISCDVGIPGYSVGASDNCSTPSLSFSAVTNGSCPQVITRIWTATDDCGNSSTASQVVTIADTTPPTITGVPADTNISCDVGIPGYSVGASDNCSTPSLSFSAVTNGSCPVVITRTWTATDNCGNSSAATQVVTIVDTTPPSLSCPNPITLTGAAVTCLTAIPDLRPTASDTCDTSVIAVTQNPAPGSMVAGPTNVSVVITASDACGNEAACTTIVSIVCPECLITEVIPTVNCNGQGTGNEADDTFSVSIVVTADNGTTFSVSGDASATGLAYGVQHTIIASRLITAGSVSLTITDDADPNCASNLVVNPPAPCSDCAITDVAIRTLCDDAGTPDPSDDTFSVTVTVTGTGVSTYAVSGDVTASGLNYGAPQLIASGLLIAGGPITINLADELGNCTSNGVMITPPAPCSACAITNVAVRTECDDRGTPSDADDRINVYLTVSGMGVSATYDVTGDITATGLIYNTEVLAGSLAADSGDWTIDLTDASGACSLTNITIPNQGPCSFCDISNAVFSITCDDNQTGDPSDDRWIITAYAESANGTTYAVTGDVSASNLAYGVSNVIATLPISGGSVTVAIEDESGGCATASIQLDPPAPCSSCSFDTLVLRECDDQQTGANGDDRFTVSLFVTGSGVGSTYAVSGDITATGLAYGVTNTLPGSFLIGAGDLSLVMIDEASNGNCTQAIIVTAPPPCSQCNIAEVTPEVTCDDNGTADPGDDTFSVSLTVTAGGGSTYAISGDASATGLAYGSPQLIVSGRPISSGGITLHVSDEQADGCESNNIVIAAPEPCSPEASIGDRVWYDDDGDGIQDPEETNGVSNVTVYLKDASGAIIATTQTDSVGIYLFDGLYPGDYAIQFDLGTLPAGYQVSPQDAGDPTDLIDSDGDPVMGMTEVTTLDPDEDDRSWDLGINPRPASIGDRVWYDDDGDGIQDPEETNGVPNVTVYLKDASGAIIATTQTDSVGIYLFDGLYPGDYAIQFDLSTLPAGYQVSPQNNPADPTDAADSDGDPVMGMTEVTTLDPDEHDPSWDLGITPRPASIGDQVWYDEDGDGIQDPEETNGVPNVTVYLKDASGAIIATTQTDSVGIYLFDGLYPGDYAIQFDLSTLPAGYQVSPQNNPADPTDAADSDGDPVMGMTEVTTLDPDEDDRSWDLGINPRPASIGDQVWYDEDGDGIQDPEETNGVPNVTVYLKDASGAIIATTQTDSVGIYLFDGLYPGDYAIQFDLSTLPAGYQVSPQNNPADPTDAADSDGDPVMGMTEVTTLDPDEHDPSWDLGITPRPASIGDRVWYDEDGDGIQDPEETNGVSNVTVYLKDASGAIIATTQTDSVGIYLFDRLYPGDYAIQFDLGTLPAGYQVSPQNNPADPTDAADSDGDPVMGMTESTTLDPDEDDRSWDLGINPIEVSIGDYVWKDLNRDGQQTAGEPGVSNITVHLLDAAFNRIDTTTTDGAGFYEFTDLPPGTYAIEFDLGTIPEDCIPTTPHVGTNDTLDSDASPFTGITPPTTLTHDGDRDDTLDLGLVIERVSLGDLVWKDRNANGSQDPGEPGVEGLTVHLLDSLGTRTGTRTATDSSGRYLFTGLLPGTYAVEFDLSTLPADCEPTQPDQGGNDNTDSDGDPFTGVTPFVTLEEDGDQDLSLDFGLIPVLTTLGDYVWKDLNRNGLQDDGEPGVSNIVAYLLDATGTRLGPSTTSDTTGFYQFTGLPPGTYAVEFDLSGLDEGCAPTSPDVGSNTNDEIDSDADPITGITPAITLSKTHRHDDTLDLGLIPVRVSLGDTVWKDLNRNGLQDDGEPGVSNIVVHLLAADGTRLDTTTTDTSGHYQFTGLKPGTYAVQFDLTSITDGCYPTEQNTGSDSDDQRDSDGDPATGITHLITLTNDGDRDDTLDLGLLIPEVSLGDFVWKDENRNGLQDAGEPGVEGITVHLLAADGTRLATTTTDTSGHYQFTGLKPGTYAVQFDLTSITDGCYPTEQNTGSDSDDQRDSDGDPATGITHLITLTSDGDRDDTLDLGLVAPLNQLGDRVWKDLNANGIQDEGEPGIAGLRVYLLDAAGTRLATTTTDALGTYRFDQLEAGTYSVQFELADIEYGCAATQPHQGGDDQADSDADPNTGETPPTTLPLPDGTHSDLSLDLGIILLDFDLALRKTLASGQASPVKAGDFVTFAIEIFNQGDLPARDVVVVDYIPSGLSLADPNWTGAGNMATRTIVGPIQPGASATVDIRLQVGPGVTGGTLANLAEIVSNGDGFIDIDSVSDNDPDNDGPVKDDQIDEDGQDGRDQDDHDIATIQIEARIFDLALRKTLATGQAPSVRQGDLVTFTITVYNQGELDAYDITLVDYIPDGFELADPNWTLVSASIASHTIAGPIAPGSSHPVDVTMRVVNAAGDLVNFAEIIFASDSSGGANVQDIDSTFDDDQGNDTYTTDDEIDGNNGDEDDHDPAMIHVEAVSLGDYVWVDLNANGKQDTSEPGLGDVRVLLLNAQGQAVAETTTDTTGMYRFDDLPLGSYQVQFDLGTVSTNYHVTEQNAQGNSMDDMDSDADPQSGLTHVVNLNTDGQHDDTLDLGVYPWGTIDGLLWIDLNNDGQFNEITSLGVQGVRVYLYDISRGSDILLDTLITDEFGIFCFMGLKPGRYAVQYELADLVNVLYDGEDVEASALTPLRYEIDLGPGERNKEQEFAVMPKPTAVSLVGFEARPVEGGVVLNWVTGSERDNLGFNLYRSASQDGEKVRVNAQLIRGANRASGAQYTHMDAVGQAGDYYWLEDVEFDFDTELHGPFRAAGEEKAEDQKLEVYFVEGAGERHGIFGPEGQLASHQAFGGLVFLSATEQVEIRETQKPLRMPVRESTPDPELETETILAEAGQLEHVVEADQNLLVAGVDTQTLVIGLTGETPEILSGKILETESGQAIYLSIRNGEIIRVIPVR